MNTARTVIHVCRYMYVEIEIIALVPEMKECLMEMLRVPESV